MRGVLRFRRKGKLSSRFIKPFEILKQIGLVAYRLALPPALSGVHDVFHVSMLRKYITDPIHVIDYEPLQLYQDRSYEEKTNKTLSKRSKSVTQQKHCIR